MAERVLRHKAAAMGADLHVESVGLSVSRIGQPATPLAIKAEQKKGYEPQDHTARSITAVDLSSFDLIVGMTMAHIEQLSAEVDDSYKGDLRGFMSLIPGRLGEDLPDPYGGDQSDYDRTLAIIEEGAENFLKELAS